MHLYSYRSVDGGPRLGLQVCRSEGFFGELGCRRAFIFRNHEKLPPEERAERPRSILPDMSTMTVIIQTDRQIDIRMLREVSFLRDGVPGKASQGTISLLVSEEGKSRFNNQVSFSYVPGAVGTTKKNCKVFANGKFHVTGVRSASEALRTLGIVIGMIRALRPDCTDVNGQVKVLSATVQMLNTDFRLDAPLNLEQLRNTISTKYGVYSRYEPDHFPGCNIKFGGATVLAFKSGSVIITGAKRMGDVAHAFAFLLGAVTECPSVIDSTGRTKLWEEKKCQKESSRGKKRFVDQLVEDRLEDRTWEDMPAFEVATR